MKSINFTVFVLGVLLLDSCVLKEKVTTVKIKNELGFERTFETVVLSKSDLNMEDLSTVGIKDKETGELQQTQLVDNDGDAIIDDILFQPKIAGNSEKVYELVNVTDAERPKAEELCYSRFVPERTDDYTWENNKVAFRMYGPRAQQMIEENIPGGTLSSGVDAWLKKVEYSIINNWYKKEMENQGAYHLDSGEGLDNFHVGQSRGVGGVAIKKGNSYYFSKNYTKWRTITTGPIRTSFYLEIGDWDVDGNPIKESKIISLDLGSNLSKFEVTISGTDTLSAGLTLHEKDGELKENNDNAWVSYWQPHADSELATAIVVPQNTFLGFEKYDVETADLSNAYAHMKVDNNKVVYYAGFTWEESGQFKNQKEWESYLEAFSNQVNTPLVVKVLLK
ncbi:DUF4861 family protein [uncultured Arcticibacterium sp.]|uniref:DUF4861 family protein n=1 Tax=uncultured Arcticibacterium sp. TaxID=2173042 RepID=UPI0030F4B8D4